MNIFAPLRRFYEKLMKTPTYLRSCAFLLCHGRELLRASADRNMRAARPPRPGAKLVIILFPAHPVRIAGGLFVLLNLASATRAALSDQGYEVCVAYPPGWPGLPTYPYYPSSERIYTFAQAMRLFPSPDVLYVHVPDCLAAGGFRDPESPEGRWLRSARELHINICNQNNELMPQQSQMAHLYALPASLSQTVAHQVNDSQKMADDWNMPILYIGAYYCSNYTYRTHKEKINIIAYSPDVNPYTAKVLKCMRRRLKRFKFYKLSGITYTAYQEAISRSKYVISFGEGWDGYFWEPFFCGTFSCCVRNPNFFPKNYDNFPKRIFDSYADMQMRLPTLIEEFEADPGAYDAYALECYRSLRGELESSKSRFFQNVARLYRQEFDFCPSAPQAEVTIDASCATLNGHGAC